jgi:hypothetical protein
LYLPYQGSFRSDKNDSVPALRRQREKPRQKMQLLTHKGVISGNLLHLVRHHNQPQEHVERRTQRCDILRLNTQHQYTGPLDPALRYGAGIHFILQLREERPVYLVGMIGCKTKQGFMPRHGKTSYGIWEKQGLKRDLPEIPAQIRYLAFSSFIAAPRSLKRIRCPQ